VLHTFDFRFLGLMRNAFWETDKKTYVQVRLHYL
jgi:hypothetical protein